MKRSVQDSQGSSFWQRPTGIARSELEQAADQYLPRIAGALFAIFALFTLAHFLAMRGPERVAMMAIASTTAAVSALLWRLWPRRRFSLRWAGPVTGWLGFLVLANCSLHMLLIPEPHLTTNFLLFLLGAGVFLFSTPWFVVLSLSTWAAWGAIVALSPPSPMWGHFGLALVTFTLVIAVAHGVRMRQVTDLFAMHRQDLEHRRHLEIALSSAQAANLAKSRFLANMSHELRTPLNSVIGFAHILTTGRFGELGERNKQFAERIHDNGRHLLVMIDDLLDLARIEAGTLVIDRREVSLEKVVRDLVADLRPQVEAKDLVLEVELPAALESIDTDQDRTRQILSNLLTNAIKFTAQGRVTLSVEAEGGRARRVVVSDSGPGIAAEHLQRIFEPFEQADTGTGRVYGGAGLGLSIARELCRALGYELSATSREGEGSTFVVDLRGVREEAAGRAH